MWFHSKKNKEPKAEEKQPEAAPQPAPQNPSNINITLNTNTGGESQVTEKEKKDTKVFIFKTISVVLVLAMAATAGYSLFSLFHDRSVTDSDSYITLQGKSYADSVKKYAAFGTGDPTKSKKRTIKDVALIGDKLFLSESKITPTLFDGSHDEAIVSGDYIGFGAYNVMDDTFSNTNSQVFSTHKYYLDLNLLSVGDYVVFPLSASLSKDKANYYPYSLATDKTMNEMFYSLPDAQGARRRITLKSNTLSPYFVIRVEDCGSQLPTNYYDAVIFKTFYGDSQDGIEALPAISKEEQSTYDSMTETINGLKRFKVKTVTSLTEANRLHAPLAIGLSLTTQKDYTSFFTANAYDDIESKTLESGELKGYDYYPEIRELAGAVSHSGEGYDAVIGNAILNPTSSPIGKETFLLQSNSNPNRAEVKKDDVEILTSFLNRF